jgi:elongator complex protein 1
LLKDIKRVDYVNLLVAHITETASSEMQYILPSKAYDDFVSHFELTLKGKKVKSVCGLLSQTLRAIDREQYIMSIFTSEIREGKLDEVLFELKEMKASEVEVVVPPHLIKGVQDKKSKKAFSAQKVLEYVCWLVDPNAIYEAALLTYDLELAAMTARCTQKDPKEYMPYFDSLRDIQDQVEFRSTICLDLKKYDIATKELSEGNKEQKDQSLALIRKHKLYKQGLKIYAGREELRCVKEFIMEELMSTGEVNEAYRVAQSSGLHQRALDIAMGAMDT